MDPSAQHRLATYGTLAPGETNHHHVADLGGEWQHGTARGRLIHEGWGAALGFPGLVLDPAGDEIAIQLLTSADLPAHWARLDDFEGEGYRRVVTPIVTRDGVLDACIYVLASHA